MLPQMVPTLKNGQERLYTAGGELPFTLQDFWRWFASDLVSNATRGCLAEFIVASALDLKVDAPRTEWASWDLTIAPGIGVEVKSAAYLQTWAQARPSSITFQVRPRRLWHADTGLYDEVPCRPARVYVFALLNHLAKDSVDPLNLDQWEFYVLPTEVLNRRARSQDSITLPSLQKLSAAIPYAGLKAAVAAAAAFNIPPESPLDRRSPAP